MMRKCQARYRTGDLTQIQRGRLWTKEYLPDWLNESGHPDRAFFIFRGFVNGAGRFQAIYPCASCRLPINTTEVIYEKDAPTEVVCTGCAEAAAARQAKIAETKRIYEAERV